MKRLYFIRVLMFITVVIAWPNVSAAMSSDTELFLIDESVLSGRVIPAISDFLVRGDSTAAKQLLREAILSQQFQTTLRGTVTGDHRASWARKERRYSDPQDQQYLSKKFRIWRRY
jgi:hypothetical protein